MTSRALAVVLGGILAAVSAVAAFSAPSNAQAIDPSGLVTLHASASPPVPAHSLALGALASGADVHVDVTLKLPDPSAVTSFIASLSDRHSANFHHFLRPGQFGEIFGPPLAEADAVDAVLRSDGLHPGKLASDHLSIPVTATASTIDRAFHIGLVRYRLSDGETAFSTLSAPSISAAVAPDVEGIIGLSDLDQPQNMLARAPVGHTRSNSPSDIHPATAGPTPCSQAADVASSAGSYTADQLASYYGMTPLYSLGDLGQGVSVALVEFETEPTASTDIAAYQECYGTDATVNYIPVDGGTTGDPSDSEGVEMALDIEDVIGLAPEATIDVYQGPSGSTYDMYSDIVDGDSDQVVSTSWGECELDSDASLLSSEQSLFYQAATQGQTVLAAAGDDGSTDCEYSNEEPKNELAVDDPASQPYVVGVGGTSLNTATQTETVWNDSTPADGAHTTGGGGLSAVWCMPSYQDSPAIPGLIGPHSESDSGDCGSTTPYLREVPDVSADADGNTGYVIYLKGYWQGRWGGTSAAAPLWAAAAALIDSSPFCSDYGSGDAGARPEGLYKIASWGSPYFGLAFRDITNGDNVDVASGYAGGLYPATTGYDMASGLGSLTLAHSGNFEPGLAAQICFANRTALDTTSVTAVSPNEGPSISPTFVTIAGSGFLPITGADELEIGTTRIAASCTTTTSCTATLPATNSGTINLVMAVEDMAISPVTASDQFTFLPPPPPPTATFAWPTKDQFFAVGQVVATTFSCSEGAGGPGISTCLDSNRSPSPGLLDTSSKGTFTYKIVATSQDGETGSSSVAYTVGASNTTLSLSTTAVTYGHEQLALLSATVSPRHPGPAPTGKVTIGESGTALCVVTLSAGSGSCTLSAKRLNTGIYHLSATYGGSTELAVSKSGRATLAVVRTATETALAMSSTTVTYGQEQTERLLVTLSTTDAGTTLTGTVTVRDSTTTLCKITLSSGTGSCRLSARKLTPGTYSLVATYDGSANFKGSSSAEKTLTAVK
ncbi:MAG: Ig-like domain repeat protein [Acidimicrobiales bacterium]